MRVAVNYPEILQEVRNVGERVGGRSEVVFHDLLEDEGYQHALNNDDMVSVYLKEAGKVPLLTASEETSLAKRIEAAGFARADFDEDKSKGKLTPEQMQNLQEVIWDGELAQEHLIRANFRLVISIAKRFVGQVWGSDKSSAARFPR